MSLMRRTGRDGVPLSMEKADASSERKYKINTRQDNPRSQSKPWSWETNMELPQWGGHVSLLGQEGDCQGHTQIHRREQYTRGHRRLRASTVESPGPQRRKPGPRLGPLRLVAGTS